MISATDKPENEVENSEQEYIQVTPEMVSEFETCFLDWRLDNAEFLDLGGVGDCRDLLQRAVNVLKYS